MAKPGRRAPTTSRSVNAWICASIHSSTATTTSRPCSWIASASARSTPRDSTTRGYVPQTD
jgi:hypothetical protein